ncbi:hypothetical protein [Rivihabitans pingtungensis]|uniref:hypothetical protein n=1 Tax=Rivihabitans pingtungensis TaxID=1054498 RepID=UPI002355DCE6|nr:hypothetical protein [Rivihabitans pingtungensis]MCK6438119.1 hypothetical protein [Rivihabitans pingtungensis]
MRINEIKKHIRQSTPSDWVCDSNRESYTYKEDANIRIERQSGESFRGEKWAECYPNSNANSVIYTVYYGNSFIEERTLVDVDGGRATLPLPAIDTNSVSRDDYHFASLVDESGTLDQYMKRSRLIVE